jgi:hypothetical protein
MAGWASRFGTFQGQKNRGFFFERYLGIGGRGDGSLEVLFLVVLGMIILVVMSRFFANT